ncbi:MAG: AAA family ATPase [Acidobacteriaceae bacterium]
MSYFATFYSYKGGVGRTLALANVAWLLANHPTEPARVLAIDFDLGAPGLFQVFGMSKASSADGIVDYVTDYLRKAAIPEVGRYIHKTAYKNIDIIPAGRMDSRYQRRLEAIDWKALYDGAFGYELLEKLKSDISSISPEYDYVLIDSLTGYTDVGGVCVNQLPDLLILLFRMNQQNLDGIERVYSKGISVKDDGARKSVIPVVTPSWPFIDEAAAVWIKKAQSIFPNSQLLEISFDSSLSFGERIITKEASRLLLASKILQDYQNLAAQVRQKNPLDPLTIWNSIKRSPSRVLADPVELYLTLLKRRPYVLEYWRGYRMLEFQTDRSSQSWSKLRAFIDQESENDNKYALFTRALMRNEKASSQGKAIDDLDKALQIDPSFSDALRERAHILYGQGKYEEAVRDFSKGLEMSQKTSDPHSWMVEAELANVYLKLFDAKAALRTIESAIGKEALDPDLYWIRARALYLEGDYLAALTDARRSAKFNQLGGAASFLSIQILAGLGRMDEAAKELEILSGKRPGKSDVNLAEAYLAVDPKKTIALLESHSIRAESAIRMLLIRLAHIFLGQHSGSVVQGSKKLGHIDSRKWSFWEIAALLRAKERAGQLSPEAIGLAYDAIQSAAGPTEFSFIQRSRLDLTEHLG